MAVDWKGIVGRNARMIVRAAQALGEAEPVCVLVDLDRARAGQVSAGVLQLIAETQLQGALLLDDPDDVRRIVCLPLSRTRLLSALGKYEDVNRLDEGIKAGQTLVLWAVCFDGDERTCLDIHVATPEAN